MLSAAVMQEEDICDVDASVSKMQWECHGIKSIIRTCVGNRVISNASPRVRVRVRVRGKGRTIKIIYDCQRRSV